MTSVTLRPPASRTPARPRLVAVKNTLVLTKRSIARTAHEPEQLLDVTIQPVIFVLLFTYVFGSATVLPGGNYHEYLTGGMFAMSMAGTASGTTVGDGRRLLPGPVRQPQAGSQDQRLADAAPRAGHCVVVGRPDCPIRTPRGQALPAQGLGVRPSLFGRAGNS
jgi:hypothetical protein